MCWIAYCKVKDLYKNLSNQKNRWLDSLWIVDFKNKQILWTIKSSESLYEYYIKDIFEWEDENNMVFMHHRKASVWWVTMDNIHPFVGNKFILSQNGTSKVFMEKYWLVYWKETDSETLLAYLEDKCNTLEECITELDKITYDIVWTITIHHKSKTLFYSDWTRWTYLVIKDTINKDWVVTYSKLESLTNYEPNSFLEYSNSFYLIVNNKTWKILKEYIHEWVNEFKYVSNYASWVLANKRNQTMPKKNSISSTNSYPDGSKKKTDQTSKEKDEKALTVVRQTTLTMNHSSTNMMKKNTLKDLQKVIDISKQYHRKHLDTIMSIESYLSDLNILSKFNDKAQRNLVNLIWILANLQIKRYDHIFNISDKNIFNYGKWYDWDRYLIDSMFLIPANFLTWQVNLFHKCYKNFWYIKHLKILLWYNIWTIELYYQALEFLLVDLKERANEWEFNEFMYEPFWLNTFWHYVYSQKIDKEKMTDILQSYILACYVLWITAWEIWINRTLYQKALEDLYSKK